MKSDILDEAIEEGDWILVALPFRLPATVEICTSQTTSQWLAKAFTWNVQLKSFQDAMPDYLHDFEDVFFKTFFDSLPECKQWNHAIELVLDIEPSNYKVYLLVPKEQDELDTFLQKNLESSRICPS